MQLRTARLNDVDALWRLEQVTFAGDRLSRRRFHHLIRRGHCALLLAEADGQLLGYLLLLFRRGSPAARLYSIAVAEAARGQGLGGLLLAAAESEALARGARRLRLEVRPDNPVAQALYRARGYRETGRIPGFYEDGAEALRLERELGVQSMDAAPGPAGGGGHG